MMKACESYIDLMMRSIDRETTPREEARLQSHLAQCEACRGLYETYRALDAGLQAAGEEPPENLTRAVMNRIHGEQQAPGPGHLLKRFRFTAIAAAAAILVLVFARFQPNVTSVAGSAANTSESTQAAAPQAELRAPEDVPEAQEPSLAKAGDALEDAVEETAVEECAPQEAEMPVEPADGDANTVAAAENDFEEINLSQMAESLRAMGLQGDVLLISGMTGEELTALFPKSSVIALDTGEIVYEVPADSADLAITAGELTVSQRCQVDSASEYLYCIVSD